MRLEVDESLSYLQPSDGQHSLGGRLWAMFVPSICLCSPDLSPF
jgi:hypothetical protein